MTASSLPFNATFRNQARAHVDRFDRTSLDAAGLVRAAVAITLVADEAGQASFVLTRRPLTLKRHAGQWALPGGRAEPDESAEETARRELDEEVGLTLGAESVVGRLDDYQTRSGFVITPVVLMTPDPVRLEPDPSEVHAAYIVPFARLQTAEIPRVVTSPNTERPLLCLPIPSLETTIWAPTACLIYQAREVIVHGRDTRVAHFDQPRFAWK